MLASEPATSKLPSKQDMPEGLKFGLPNHWYPILESHQLGDKPTCIERFGKKLAVWRDKDGRAAVFHNHCPHRRAPLSLGSVHGEALVCAYHGWRFNRDGDCIEKPWKSRTAPATKDIQ